MDRAALFRFLIAVVAIVTILSGCFIVLKPFIPAIFLAIVFTMSTWPAFIWLENRMGHRTRLAALAMSVLLGVCFLAPLLFLGSSLAESFTVLLSRVTLALQTGPTDIPDWLRQLPWVGTHVAQIWNDYFVDKKHMTDTIRQYAGPVSQRLIGFGANIGHGFLEVSLGVLVSYFLFWHGKDVIDRLRTLLLRFGGPTSLRLLKIVENTVMGMVYGILGTALALGVLATIGFWIAGVPGAALLGLVTFLLGIIPGGPPIVLAPVTFWLFYEGHVAMGLFLAIWSIAIVTVMDIIVRPYFISLGAKMPILLVLFGIFGGIAAFGFIGLFIGPALLAVAYALVLEWSQEATPLPESTVAYGPEGKIGM